MVAQAREMVRSLRDLRDRDICPMHWKHQSARMGMNWHRFLHQRETILAKLRRLALSDAPDASERADGDGLASVLAPAGNNPRQTEAIGAQ
jgi:L-ascorbate metabolism protein UlaG (beta-lactamase superfamily)